MSGRAIACIVAALLAHGVVLLFGGIIFMGGESAQSSKRDVELLTEAVDKDRPDDQPKEQVPEELKADTEPPPDANQVLRSMETEVAGEEAPALDAASLSAIEQTLNGGAAAAGGEFGASASLASGGRIGGTGRAGAADREVEGAFSMSEIDQRPRPVQQVGGTYPSEMRAKNIEGVVTLIFIVDETGRVVNPRVEKSSHTEFEAPALEAVRQWKFEPAIKAGKRVSCRMRVPLRFQPR